MGPLLGLPGAFSGCRALKGLQLPGVRSAAGLGLFPEGFKYPNMKHIPQIIITVLSAESIDTQYFGTLNPQGLNCWKTLELSHGECKGCSKAKLWWGGNAIARKVSQTMSANTASQPQVKFSNLVNQLVHHYLEPKSM